MLCQNCGKNEVTFHYTQIINGVKKEMTLCNSCAEELGLKKLDFNMPIDFSSFLGEFFSDMTDESLLPHFNKNSLKQCEKCGMTYQDFINTGKLGCNDCYTMFAENLEPVLKNIQGSHTHVGRKSKLSPAEKKSVQEDIEKVSKQEKIETKSKLEILKEDLKIAIKDERYEDAAKIRDEIKKIEK